MSDGRGAVATSFAAVRMCQAVADHVAKGMTAPGFSFAAASRLVSRW